MLINVKHIIYNIYKIISVFNNVIGMKHIIYKIIDNVLDVIIFCIMKVRYVIKKIVPVMKDII